ncbi:hypothetical protein ACFWAY_22260 [Rhodococcus sp. NPDC059968]|uniref:hypothetical protein n=1 Tax=Rhodococcus sp. NPDC059968 TaxID=3347017 RepID=UPI003670F4AF
MTGIRIHELRLVGTVGSGKTYGASFREATGFRPLSIITGPSLTGKTSIIDYIKYCLGDNEHPQHQEVLQAVRTALVETELDGQPTVIERTATGSPSKVASVWRSRLEDMSSETELRVSTAPPSDPDGLSQLVLASCNLDGVLLANSSVKEETATQLLSIRDVFNVMFVPNHRLDNKSLVFEQSHHMVRQKFRQTVDAIFGIHDNEDAVLANRYRTARELARSAQVLASTLHQLAETEHPRGPIQLQNDLDGAVEALAQLTDELASLDEQQRSSERASARLRRELNLAQSRAKEMRVRVRDRRSLVARLDALRGQYADDQRKLNFLLDAERLFDPLQVVTCPACLGTLAETPTVQQGQCTLCDQQIASANENVPVPTNRTEPPATNGQDKTSTTALAFKDERSAIMEAELRAVSKRLKSLNEYVARLTAHQRVLEDESIAADSAGDAAAQAVDAIVTSPAPWLALRDNLSRGITEARLTVQSAQAGVNIWRRVAQAEANHERLAEHAQEINAARQTQRQRPARTEVIRALSTRFGEILESIGYPKLSNPYIGDDLVPYVRGLPYTNASSGGMVVIALAWNLALWEVAHERNADAPGLLVIDSPQKNLGHNSKPGDDDFADARLVENFYTHAKNWLATDGAGAQLIVIDNSPPPSLDGDVVVRYTRKANAAPYGLIPEATS